MKKMSRLLAACLISGASGCLHRADSLRMLDERADYAGKELRVAQELKLGGGQALHEETNGKPSRSTPKVAHIWIFPHETPTKEYFWGGWISMVIEGDQWQVSEPQGLLPEKPETTIPNSKG